MLEYRSTKLRNACSMFLLESCKGFLHNTFHLWCCTQRQCNLQYTEKAIADLGYPMPDALEILTCHERLHSGKLEEHAHHKSFFGCSNSDVLALLLTFCLPLFAVSTLSTIVLCCH